MIINNRRRFIFYHVPKAAGTSIRAALMTEPGSERVGRKHMTPEQFRETLRLLKVWRYRFYVSFCFVRDPWERFGALHRYLTGRPIKGFTVPADVNDLALALEQRDPWLMARHTIRPQVQYAHGVTFVGRFEQVERDFADIAARIGMSDIQLPRRNASGPAVCHRDGMTERTQAVIRDCYREDIARFGYR